MKVLRYNGKVLKYNGKILKSATSTSETWIINQNSEGPRIIWQYISFTSNGQSFKSLKTLMAPDGWELDYLTTSGELLYVYAADPSSVGRTEQWLDQAYRTITFDAAPTGDLLTWLQANAVKQASV